MRLCRALLCLTLLAPTFATAGTGPPFGLPRSAVIRLDAGAKARAYDLYVATPPGYDRPENAARRYPLVVINDGDLFFAAAAGAMQLAWHNGVSEPAIIVGLSYAVGEDPIASRTRDLTPVASDAFKQETGGAADYLRFIADDALPEIERRYRVDPQRRSLVGHSFGGTFAAFAMLTEPSLFQDYVLISPALWYGDHMIARLEAEYAATHDDLSARVFIAAGDLEGPKGGLKAVDLDEDAASFAARLRSRAYGSLDLRHERFAGADHSATFPGAFMQAMRWLYDPPKR